MNKGKFRVLEICGGVVLGAVVMAAVYMSLPDHLKAAVPILHRGPEMIDIAVTDVELVKAAGANDANYSRYLANVTVRNNGRSLHEKVLTVSSGEEHYSVNVSTKQHDVSLSYGDSVTLERYEVFVNNNYNGEMITFRVEVSDEEDMEPLNNVFTKGVVDFDNEGLGEVFIAGVNGKRINLTQPVNLGEDFDYYMLHSNNTDLFPEKEFTYRELADGATVLSYYTAETEMSDLETLKRFTEVKVEPLGPIVAFAEDVYTDPMPHIFVLKAVKRDKTIYAYSNFIASPVQAFLNRAEFAKLLVEGLNIELEDEGTGYYADMGEDHWYEPYVKTLVNKGYLLLGREFQPGELVTRGEVAEAVVEARDVPFVVEGGVSHFADVARGNSAYYAVEALYASGNLKSFGSSFTPEHAATRAFLDFLLK